MLNMIRKQIWNQRGMNGWIFIELVIAGFFLWTVIEPVYVLMVNHFEPKGYEEKGRYVLNLGAFERGHASQDTTLTAEERREAFIRIAKLVNDQPEVEASYIAPNQSFPNALGWSGGQVYPDTASVSKENYVHMQSFFVCPEAGSDMFRTLGIKDVNTGKELVVPEDAVARDLRFVSESLAKALFGTTQVVGKKVYTGRKNAGEIGGVFQDVKTRDYTSYYSELVKT